MSVSASDLPNLFDRFFSKGKKLTGLGFAFCKMVMEDMKGSIECTSKPGKYTLFTLRFPISYERESLTTNYSTS
jgi:signal transduction histidine kinase